jgi:nicotinamide-nucleotide amidase
MRVEIVAIGTELLLGQIADTNGAWLGEHLAAGGVDSHFHQAVGDNHGRIVAALRMALGRSDAVIMCGGLGPTHDDLTRDAIAEVMGVPLERDPVILARIEGFFAARGREMSPSNARQADVPRGATTIDQVGTAPGLICPVGAQVMYAVPGVPSEMKEMFASGILPDLRRRMAEAGESGAIVSRVVRTWGTSESALADLLAARIEVLDQGGGNPTLAFLASGTEGIKIRITAKAADLAAATALVEAEATEVAAVVGDAMFGIDDQSMEVVVAGLLQKKGWTLGLAESLTGGLVASRLVGVPGSSAWFAGSVVAYASAVKFAVLGVPEGPVVTAESAGAMAEGARRVLAADVGLALTGVAGPDGQDGRAPGTVFVGLALPDRSTESIELSLPGDRERVRQYAAVYALDALRRRLDESA